MKVALVLYPGLTALDVVGPFQVLAVVPGVETMSKPQRSWSFRAASSTATSTQSSWTGRGKPMPPAPGPPGSPTKAPQPIRDLMAYFARRA